ncbi:MAG: UvrD-helicase domain-containing protein [Janthinobacterium lividum]
MADATSRAEPVFTPLAEQQRAVELFRRREGLRIDAYAGTGKTTTLRLLAESTSGRGLYLAFNRSIATEAASRFPKRVRCATAHSIAFRGIRRALRYPEWKLTEALAPRTVTEAFRMPETVSFACGLVLDRQAYVSVLLKALARFLQSSEDVPSVLNVDREGLLETLSVAAFQSFAQQAAGHVQAIWDAMQLRDGGLPLGHDGYLKLWALSNPKAETDYILVDEAQDMNPVLFGVLKGVQCPVVYVGDPYQQIYEWRGAVNAMDEIVSPHHVLLAQSFRFGPEIAAAATKVLRTLGASTALRGSAAIRSELARVRPDAILSRSNAGVIANLLYCLKRNVRCAVVGGTRTLQRLLEDVLHVQQGKAAQTPELLGFQSWREVMSFSRDPEGEHLRGLVNLVQEHGAEPMLSAIARCEQNEINIQVVCSTAHRAKGREWKHVHLDADFEQGFLRASRNMGKPREAVQDAIDAEARLLYVGITRASLAVSLPQDIRKRFGLRHSTDQTMGP